MDQAVARKPLAGLAGARSSPAVGSASSRRRLPRSRGPLAVQARRRRQDAGEEDAEQQPKQGLLANILGGTQRLKVGQTPAGEAQAQAKQPAGGTRRLRLPGGDSGTQRLGRQAKPGGFLQGLGSGRVAPRDPSTVFVAGATGRLGLRVVRELLLAGFRVRAGARNVEKAQEYAATAAELGLLPGDAAKRLQIVTVDLEDEETIAAAIGNAGKVVQAIGAAESNVLDFGAPKRVDGDASVNLVNAAAAAGVQQFVMVTSLGTGKFGWPASALNLFGGILLQKRRAEKALEESGLAYCIVRPGGMERPTDDHGRTHNVRLATRDTTFGGTVSRLQVAQLVAAAVANPDLAENKVLEVVAETTAPALEWEALLEAHPTEVSQAERAAAAEAAAAAAERYEAAQEQLEAAAEERAAAAERVAELQAALREKQAAAKEAQAAVAPVLREAQALEAQLARVREENEASARREEAAKAVASAARQAQRQGRVLSSEDIAAIEASILNPQQQEEPEQEAQAEAAPEPAAAAPKQKRQAPWALFGKQQQQEEEAAPAAAAVPAAAQAVASGAQQLQKKAEQAAPKQVKQAVARAPKQAKQAVQAPTQAAQAVAEPVQAAVQPAAAAVTQQQQQAPKKPAQSAEEIDALREARAKAAQARADKEAQFLAQLEADRREEAAKKREEAEKRAEAARKELLEQRRALAAKQEENAKKAAAEEQQRQEAAAAQAAAAASSGASAEQAKANAAEARAWIDAWRKGAAITPAPAPAAAAAKPAAADAGASAEEAKQNAAEARAWIDAWRKQQAAGAVPAAPAAKAEPAPASADTSAEQAKQNAADARAWIDAWRKQQANGASPAGGEAAATPSNVAEAREWIRDWRARTLEAKLPAESRAKQQQ